MALTAQKEARKAGVKKVPPYAKCPTCTCPAWPNGSPTMLRFPFIGGASCRQAFPPSVRSLN